MKQSRLFLEIIKIGLICFTLYFGYTAYTDFRNFTDHPVQSFKEFFTFKKEEKIDTVLLENEILKKSEYIFAENRMKIEHQFHQQVGLAKVEAKYQWNANTKFGVKKGGVRVQHTNNQVIVKIHLITIFKTSNENINRVFHKENWQWTDQDMPEISFRTDMPFAARDIFIVSFSDDKKHRIIGLAKRSLKDFITPLIKDRNIKITVEVLPVFEHEEELAGLPSKFYQNQKTTVLSNTRCPYRHLSIGGR